MAVAFDAVGPGASGQTLSGTGMPLSLNWSHTCSGSNLALIVVVALGTAGSSSDAGITISASYGGVGMTSLGLARAFNQNNGYVQMFGVVVANAGTATVSLTASGSTAGGSNTLVGGSTSYSGVDPVSPFSGSIATFGNSATASGSVSSASGNMVVDGVGCGSPIGTSSTTQRWLNNFSQNSGAGCAASSSTSGASTVTPSYTVTSDWWGFVATNLRAYVAPAVPIAMAWVQA